MVNNETFLHSVGYYSKFPVVKKVESMSAEDLIWETKVVFAEFGLPQKFVLAVGMNSVSEVLQAPK